MRREEVERSPLLLYKQRMGEEVDERMIIMAVLSKNHKVSFFCAFGKHADYS